MVFPKLSRWRRRRTNYLELSPRSSHCHRQIKPSYFGSSRRWKTSTPHPSLADPRRLLNLPTLTKRCKRSTSPYHLDLSGTDSATVLPPLKSARTLLTWRLSCSPSWRPSWSSASHLRHKRNKPQLSLPVSFVLLPRLVHQSSLTLTEGSLLERPSYRLPISTGRSST